MAPYTFSPTVDIFITLVTGFFFGLVLERAGFGDSRNLAAQFYLYDMRVLKVMFTAIVTAMVLIFAAAALGLVDFGRVWVPPTHLWPAVLGGFVLGVGFIIGGYCPGTSLVAASTLKLDGMIYAAGVLFGLFVFGETVPAYWSFFTRSGELGRLTLFDWLDVDAGVVVLGVVLMAVGAFWFAEFAERLFARDGHLPPQPSPTARLLRRATVGVGVAVAAATLLLGQPSVDRRVAWANTALDQALAARQAHIDPSELLGLMHNNQVQVVLADVRSQSDYNLFHLLDAQNVSPAQLNARWAAHVPDAAVVVVMSNDEQAADAAWKRLAVLLNPSPTSAADGRTRVYVLAGGVNRWLDIYGDGRADAPGPEAAPSGDDTLRHHFDVALGSGQHAISRPALKNAPERACTAKVHLVKAAHAKSGGCG